ncbi:MAG TPA: SNF2-related protein, partial [Geminicoccaceae bacterium]|nr:SNF2-related protein [Geminicoccaceae bacterium]
LAEAALPRPRPIGGAERRRVAPRPVLSLDCPAVPVRPVSPWDPSPPAVRLPLAGLGFDYGGKRIAWTDQRAEIVRFDGARLEVLPRDRAAERRAVRRLRRLDLIRLGDGRPRGAAGGNGYADAFVLPDPDPLNAWADFNHVDVPRLRAEGWEIEFAPDYPLRVVEGVDDWYADLGPGENGWFGLDIGIEVEGGRVPLLPVLLDLLRKAPDELIRHWLGGTASAEDDAAGADDDDDLTLYAPLPDGRLLPVPLARLRAILRALFELLDGGGVDADGRLRLDRARAGAVTELEDALPAAALRWRGGEELRALGRRLRGLDGLPAIEPPRGLTAVLRPYQRDGLAWLQFLRDFGFHGVLADDMGLGKTVQTLAHILTEREAGRLDRPCLVVAPTSLMPTWRGEAARFAPDLRVLTLHGPGRRDRFAEIADHDVVLTSYALLLRDAERLLAHGYHVAVLDEAQAIKNPSTKLAHTVGRIDARHRLCLTGTPMENHLGELWSLFHYLMPGFLGDRQRFARIFRAPVERHGDQARADLLARRVRPFLLRRTKDEVAPQLPPKSEILREVELEAGQRDLYESVRLAMHAKVREAIAARGLAQSGITVLEALLKLRQVCCDPRLLKTRGAAARGTPSAKLELLFELLPTMLDEGRRVLLFSQFVEMLALIEDALALRKLGYVKLTGRTRDRAAPVERFQAGGAPLFLISLKAGGT